MFKIRSGSIRYIIEKNIIYVFLSICAVIAFGPFLWMLLCSFKTTAEIYTISPVLLPQKFLFSNYTQLFVKANFARYYINSSIITGLSVLLNLFFCSLTGFAFAKYKFRFQNILFIIVLGSMMIPMHVTLVPLFILLRTIGWLNTYQGVIVPGAASAFGVFLCRQYMLGIPSEFMDQARIDGCGEFRIYAQIILPMAMPVLAALAIVTFLFSWNALLWPLIVLNDESKFTLTVKLAQMAAMVVGRGGDAGILMAAAAISTFPVLGVYFSLQKRFVSGLLSTYK